MLVSRLPSDRKVEMSAGHVANTRWAFLVTTPNTTISGLPIKILHHCIHTSASCSYDEQDRQTNVPLQQNRLRWYGHVLRREDDNWVKKCMKHEVEGPRPRGRPKRPWRVRSWRRTVKHANRTRRMLWMVVDGGRR